mgnify:CR=1 FL=1
MTHPHHPSSIRALHRAALPALLAGALALAGCAATTAEGEHDTALTLFEPADQTLVRGTTNKLLVVVDRDNVPGDLEIEIHALPHGVDVVEDDPRIAAGERSATVTLHTEADADLTTGHPMRVEVESPDGLTVSEWIEVDVVARR